MTLTSGDNFKGSMHINPHYEDRRSHVKPNAYLNRTVYLNGISVSILNENYRPDKFGEGAVRIKIRWDKYDVENDVRWCADSIRLSANDFDNSFFSLNIKNGATVLIDRSLSPTYDYRDSAHLNFTVPTVFTCLKNSAIMIEGGGRITVEHGSILEMDSLSLIHLRPKTEIIVRNGGRLIMRGGSRINTEGGKIIIEETGAFEFDSDAMVHLISTKSALQIKGKVIIDGRERKLRKKDIRIFY
jgi:hypothetical protein